MEIAAILLSPVIAVCVTLWFQSRKEKRDRKNHLFSTLMVHRKSFPPNAEWVNALNLIDIVFAGNPKVINLWHEYYSMLGSAQTDSQYRDRDHKYLEMLSEMAKVLGYKKLQQTDIDKFYSPQVHQNQLEFQAQIQSELLRVLKNTNNFNVEPIEHDSQA